MSTTWPEDDEEFKVGGVKGGLRAKPRFSFTEVKLLLEAVKRNRYIILKKFNQGVSAEAKKETWTEITNQINGLGENHREVRQIMKKWADLKCDGKRRIVALRGPNGNNLRKKKLGPVEKMVHKILMMSPRADDDSDLDMGEDDDLSKHYTKGLSSDTSSYAYLSVTDGALALPGGATFDLSPLSSPEKDLGGDPFHSSPDFDDDGEQIMDFDENDDSLFSSCPLPPPPPPPLPPPPPASLDPLPEDVLMRIKPVHTYSRNSSQTQNHTQNQNASKSPPEPSPSVASTSSDAAPLPSQSPSSVPPPPPAASSAANDATSDPSSSSSSSTSIPPPPSAAVPVASSVAPTVTSAPSSTKTPPPSFSSSSSSAGPPSDPLPAGASSCRSQDQVAQVASQSLQQQRASRMLLTSMSQSLETLAQSVQLLVESQQEFVQESLLLQRETVDILREFSNTALAMLRDKANNTPLVTHHHTTPRY